MNLLWLLSTYGAVIVSPSVTIHDPDISYLSIRYFRATSRVTILHTPRLLSAHWERTDWPLTEKVTKWLRPTNSALTDSISNSLANRLHSLLTISLCVSLNWNDLLEIFTATVSGMPLFGVYLLVLGQHRPPASEKELLEHSRRQWEVRVGQSECLTPTTQFRDNT